MKRFLILCLLVACCGTALAGKYTIDAINPSPETNPPGAHFPGYRGPDQLVVYTPEFGRNTGTNEYGREVTVINGRVFGFNGADSYIPADGFVVSGHGRAKKWINRNFIEGAYVTIYPETNTIESIITPDSYLYRTEHRLNEVKKVMLSCKRNLPGYQYSSAQKYYTASLQKYHEAKYYISTQNYDKAKKRLSPSLTLANEAFYHAVPGVRGEFHGIWLRPVEKTRSQIANTLQKLKETGFEHVFLETYYQGYTIFPSRTMQKYGLTPQREEFAGNDPLEDWIEEAHERDMKIHVWFQAFYAGNDDVRRTPGHVLFVYPEWANVQRKNALEDVPMPSGSEHNGYFLDPANHMARNFLLELIGEITLNYEIDGINIDYIRYPKSLSVETPGFLDSTWGYTEYARQDFLKQHGKDPMRLTLKSELWKKWESYRQEQVTKLLSKLKSTINNDKIMISAVIFPDYEETLRTKHQNWPEWAERSYIDALTPLLMGSDDYRASAAVREIKEFAGDSVLIYPGLFEPFTAGDPINLLKQIMAIRKAGAAGVVVFDNAHLSENFRKALGTRVFVIE